MGTAFILVADPRGEAGERVGALVRSGGLRALWGQVTFRTFERGSVVAALVDLGGGCGFRPEWQDRGETADSVVGVTLAGHLQGCALDATVEHARSGSEQARLLAFVAADGMSVVVVNDGVGFIPAYYAAADGRLLLSTSLHALVGLGVDVAWDLQGVAEYLGCLHPLGERTLLRGVSAFPAGGRLRWSPVDGLALSCQPLLARFAAGSTAVSTEERLEEYRAVWQQALSRLVGQAQDTLVLGLSGGLDSRTLAGGMAWLGQQPKCFTYGNRRNREVRSARRVARCLKLPHQVIPVRPEDAVSHVQFCIAGLDGAHSAFESYEGWYRDRIAGMGRSLITGTSGDILWGHDSAFGALSCRDALENKLRQYLPSLTSVSGLLDPDFVSQAPALLEQGLTETMEAACRHASGRDLASLWNLSNRQRRWGFSLTSIASRGGIQLANPFFDSGFLAFAQSLPLTELAGGRFHLRIHREVYARTARIPYTSIPWAPPPAALDGLYPGRIAPPRESWMRCPSFALRYGVGRTALRYVAGAARRVRGIEPLHLALCASLRDVEPVFDHRTWLASSRSYADGFRDIVQLAAQSAPGFVRAPVLAADDRKGLVAGGLHPLLVGRVVCLCLWNRLWSDLRMNSAR